MKHLAKYPKTVFLESKKINIANLFFYTVKEPYRLELYYQWICRSADHFPFSYMPGDTILKQ